MSDLEISLDSDPLREVREFESQLDAWLDGLPSVRADGAEALLLAGEILEYADSRPGSFPGKSLLARGFDVLAEHWMRGTAGPAPDVMQLIEDLNEAGHYYILRDYLYYTYNAPGSLAWSFEPGAVTVRFVDRSIPRQFFLSHNTHILNSLSLAEQLGGDDEAILGRLRGEEEFGETEALRQVLPRIQEEAELKLRHYYRFLPEDSTIDLGGFTYAEYHRVFRVLLTKALYHRYHARANDHSGCVVIGYSELIRSLPEETGVAAVHCERILREITYSDYARRGRAQPMYFGLYELPGRNAVMMRPHEFAMWEGLINVLRLTALRRPRQFLRTVSGPLGAAMVRRVADAFAAQGFRTLTNVDLRTYDPTLPDIDLLVISEEPTLGYVMFLCEVKNPVPSQWAKDHLRLLAPDSVAKAFGQLDRIRAFLATERGAAFLRAQVPQAGLPHFGGNFVILVHDFVITSQNTGMFFSDRSQHVVDYVTLERLVARSDGDVAYLITALKGMGAQADATLETSMVRFGMETCEVRYEAVTGQKAILDFPRVEYRSAGVDAEIAREFIRHGGHPFGVLVRRKNVRWFGPRPVIMLARGLLRRIWPRRRRAEA